jgi:hypothetical protein
MSDSAAEGTKGPITGPVNGLEAIEDEKASPAQAAREPEEAADELEGREPAQAEPEAKTAKTDPALEKPAEKKPEALAIPTHNLPRDPAKASDVLVHRALPLIRRGELRLAEATLDRAWELDPKNPLDPANKAARARLAKSGAKAAN